MLERFGSKRSSSESLANGPLVDHGIEASSSFGDNSRRLDLEEHSEQVEAPRQMPNPTPTAHPNPIKPRLNLNTISYG